MGNITQFPSLPQEIPFTPSVIPRHSQAEFSHTSPGFQLWRGMLGFVNVIKNTWTSSTAFPDLHPISRCRFIYNFFLFSALGREGFQPWWCCTMQTGMSKIRIRNATSPAVSLHLICGSVHFRAWTSLWGEGFWYNSNLNLYPALLQGINSWGTGEFSQGGRRAHLGTSVSFELLGLVTIEICDSWITLKCSHWFHFPKKSSSETKSCIIQGKAKYMFITHQYLIWNLPWETSNMKIYHSEQW